MKRIAKSSKAQKGNGIATQRTNGRASGPLRYTRAADKIKNTEKQRAESKFFELMLNALKDMYWAEKQLVRALTKMQKASTSEVLAKAFGDHRKETEGHIKRLEQVFDIIGKKPVAKKCAAMEGLIEEGRECIEDTESDTMVRDAGLIICAQKVEHYEIASYGGICAIANRMGYADVADVLHETLNEEKHADELLTEIAESAVNEQATQE